MSTVIRDGHENERCCNGILRARRDAADAVTTCAPSASRSRIRQESRDRHDPERPQGRKSAAPKSKNSSIAAISNFENFLKKQGLHEETKHAGAQACCRAEGARLDEAAADEQDTDGCAHADIARCDSSPARSGKHIGHAGNPESGGEIAGAQSKDRTGGGIMASVSQAE